MPIARFDDLARGTSFALSDPVGSYTANDLADVTTALEWARLQSCEGRWVAGYVSYDAAPAFDPALAASHRSDVPYAWFGAFAGQQAVSRRIDRPIAGRYGMSRWRPMVDRLAYEDAFATVREHIRLGDSYQVNLTFPLRAAFSGDPGALYEDLLEAQEAGFACHLAHDDLAVLSVSPERFFAVDGGSITTRPMKGTRPRGRWDREDEQLRSDLGASDKDRAENLMIVDLIRNDLGRIAAFGSVEVEELFAIEAYRTVWQMTSQVSAELRNDVSLVDVFAALFPCGSVTGAPKARSMEIIERLEPRARGVYCGAIGFIPPGDGLDGASFNVAIRTVVVHASEGVGCYGVGGGITWGSDVETEYAEALTKASVLAADAMIPGVFTTVRWDGAWLWLDEHMARLAGSCSRFALPFDEAAIRGDLDEMAAGFDRPMRVRIDAHRSGQPTFTAEEAPARFSTGPGPDADVVMLGIDFDPVDSSDLRLFHKTADRSLYDLRAQRHREWDDVLLTNDRGMVTESTIANLAVSVADAWITPPVSDGLLPGIMRQHLLQSGQLVERSVTVRDVVEARALAVFNSVRGWVPATLVSTGVGASVRDR